MHRLTSRLALGLAAIALLASMGGGAYAAGLLDGNKLKNRSVGLAKLKLPTIKALKGKAGPAGKQGPAGPAGPAGSNGVGGSNGVNGVTSVGQPGQQGPAGAGVTPLTFGPYAYSGVDHSQICGGPQWASVTGNRTFIIVPTVSGLFDVTELVEGRFTVNSGNLGPISSYPLDATINSPGGTGGCGFTGSRVSAGVGGRYFGETVYIAFSAAFDFGAQCAAGCAPGAFFNSVFGTPTPPPVGSLQMHFRSDAGNAWNFNAISGPPNSGDILQ